MTNGNIKIGILGSFQMQSYGIEVYLLQLCPVMARFIVEEENFGEK